MRVCIVGTSDITVNPRVVGLGRSLTLVGHDVSFVCGRNRLSAEGPDVTFVATRVPVGFGILGRTLRRIQPVSMRRASFRRRLVKAIVAGAPELIYAMDEPSVTIASRAAPSLDAAIVRSPRLPSAGPRDIVALAPSDLRFSSSPSGRGSSHHTARDDRASWVPLAGRHSGLTVVLAGRQTPTTPGRHLRAAMERAGMAVYGVERLDWTTMPEAASFVVIVESPYPALEIIGENPGIPVLFWAHHGEHHTEAHLRLIERYGVDSVLLAHSWHLAHRYPVPVHRFPFAVAPELVRSSVPWSDRRFDVAFAGSLGGERTVYGERRWMLESIMDRLGADSVVFVEGISPEEMAGIYADARAVVNDGGRRHHPITMRVFEAIGSGCALVTVPSPGLECLFSPGLEYVETSVKSAAEAASRVARSDEGREVAERAVRVAEGHHTYDHRVDELIEIATGVTHGRSRWPGGGTISSPIISAVRERVDIGSMACYGDLGAGRALPLVAVWNDPVPGARTYDAVVAGAEATVDVRLAIGDAVRYVIADADHPAIDGLKMWAQAGGHAVDHRNGCLVIDLQAPGYRLVTEGAL